MNYDYPKIMVVQKPPDRIKVLLSPCSLLSSDPVFVGSAYIEESQPIGNPVGDDDKIYFFFSEAAKEFDFFDNTIVSRIARVCKVRHKSGEQGWATASFPGPGTQAPLSPVWDPLNPSSLLVCFLGTERDQSQRDQR